MSELDGCEKCKSFSKSAFSCITNKNNLAIISNSSVALSYEKGQEIYREGTIPKGVFCVERGKIKLFKKCPNRNIVTGLAGNSDFLGYQAILFGGNYNHSAKCFEDSEICFIPKKRFLDILADNPPLLYELLKRSCNNNNQLVDFIKDIKCSNSLSRVSKTIIILGKKYGMDENNCVNVELTRKDIAEISGVTTESAIKILGDMKREKLISFHNNKIKAIEPNKIIKYFSH